jgi:hypothetical protein
LKSKPKTKPPQLNRTNARALKLMLERRAVQRVVAFVMNEWCRRSVEEPEAFEQAMITNERFLLEQGKGELPSYGVVSARYLVELLADLTKPKVSAVRQHKQGLKSSHHKPTKRAR